nr:PREDICTED: probable serine/threonine-protein kinase kinX [Musa acuminata subsp. malaccensis]
MASEASVTDQTVKEHMGTNVSDNINNADEALLSKIEDLKGKDEEEISKGKDEEKVDAKKDPTTVEAPTAEPEEKLDQEVATVIEEVEEEAKDKFYLEPSVEAEEKELKDKSDALVTPEPLNEPVDQPTEISEPSVAEEPVETPKENAHSETVTEESTSAEESSEVSAAVSPPSLTDDKPVESPTLCNVQEPAPNATVALNAVEAAADRETACDGVAVSPESSKQLPPIETIESESSDAVTVVPSVNELIESTERTDDDRNADSDTRKLAGEELVPEVEVAERNAEPVVDVKQEQENTMDVEATALSKTNQSVEVSEDVKVIVETKNENLEGEDLSLDTIKSAEEIVPEVEDAERNTELEVEVAEPITQPVVDVKQEQENTKDVEATDLSKINQTVNASEDFKVISETKNENLEGEDLSLDAKKSAREEFVPEVEVAEHTEGPVVDIKQEQEKTMDVEATVLSEPNLKVNASEDVKVIGEMKNENSEGADLRLAETSRDIDFAGVENKASAKNQECDPKDSETAAKPVVKQTLLDKFVEESTEDKEKESVKVYDQSLAASTKDDDGATKTDGAPKSETPAKKSQRNIISKVKQSIVKVKKAIIGRSPSSKTMAAAEGIEDTKQK